MRTMVALLIGGLSVSACALRGRIPARDFESFTIAWGSGPCPGPPLRDCGGFIELRADGTLRYDRKSEIPVVVRETRVAPEELTRAIGVLTDPGLVWLLDRLTQP
jgi:hypothetical protein